VGSSIRRAERFVRRNGEIVDPLLAIAEFAVGMNAEDLSDAVREQAGTLLVDSIACTVAALRVPEGRAIARALHHPDAGLGGTRPPYRPYLSGELLGGVQTDAYLANLLDFDDVYEGSGHIGCVTVPAALRAALMARATGAEALAAVTVGFEAGCRLAEATRPTDAARQQIWGIGSRIAPAAAAGAARALRMTVDQTRHAIAIACATAPLPSVRKTVYGGHGVTWMKNNMGAAAAAGLSAALMAREGARGPTDIFEGAQGFARMIGSDTWKPAVLSDELERTWRMEQLGLKAYPCCRHAHAVIDAARGARDKAGLTPAQIEDVRVAGPLWIYREPFTNPAPSTMHDAQYSLPFILAMALLEVEPGLAWFAEDAYTRADVLRLAGRVRTGDAPSSVGRVTVAGAGRTETVAVDAPRGAPAAPLSREERRRKIGSLLSGWMTARAINRTFDRLEKLGAEPDIRSLLEAFPGADLRPSAGVMARS
jgi:2-methylcitrate dehydratase PrpD